MDGKKKRKSPANFLLALGLCLMLVCSGVAYLFHTNVGKLTVREITYETQYGSLSGTVYRPNSATATALAPAVVLAHGYGESRETQSAAAIELSRRGYIVFSVDLYGHGHSTLKTAIPGKDAEKLLDMNAAGLWDAVNYIQNLNYANKAKVAIAGVSTKTFDVLSKAIEFDNMQIDAIAATAAQTPAPRISAVLYAGSVPKDYGYEYLRGRDIGICAAFKKSSMTEFLEGKDAHTLVNGVRDASDAISDGEPIRNGFDKLKDAAYVTSKILYTEVNEISTSGMAVGAVINAPTAWENGSNAGFLQACQYAPISYTWARISATGTRTVLTGILSSYTLVQADIANGVRVEVTGTVRLGARAVYAYTPNGMPRPFKQTTAYINFFGNATHVRPSAYLTAAATSESVQTWWIKEAMTGLALIGFFMFVISAAFALYGAATRKKLTSAAAAVGGAGVGAAEGVSAEGGLIEAAPAYEIAEIEKPYTPDAPGSKAGRLIYWFGFGLTIILSGLFFWLMFRAGEGSFNGFFSQPVTNGILLALIVTGVIGLGLFVLSAFLNKKYAGGPGLKKSLLNGVPAKAPNIVKSLLIAAGVVFAGFSIAGFVQWLWQVDFRFWLWAVNTFELRVFGAILKYLLFFAVYFVMQSFIINNGVAAKRREVWNYLLAIAVSAGGLALLGIIYWLAALGGANLFGQSLLPTVSIMMIPLLALSAVISRLAYNKTGTIWLGAILNTVLMTALLCAGTVTLY